LRLNRAIDVWLGELALQGRSKDTLEDYRRDLYNFADRVDPHGDRDVGEISEDDCRAYLNRFIDKSPSTLASKISIVKGLFRFFAEREQIAANPMARIKRPKRQRPEDLDVVEVSSDEVRRIIRACADWQELICIGAAGYMGRRRTALANARRRDLDLAKGVVRFRDKGGKVIHQPVPAEFLDVLAAADQHSVWDGPDDWLIPPRRKTTTGTKRRESKVVYETVVKVAARAGVRAHAHALRAAFAVQFLETHPGKIESVKELLGHARMETTMVYLRRMNRAKAMDDVRDLSWGGPFVFSPRSEKTPGLQEKAHTGFEPVFGESADEPIDPALISPVRAKLDELLAKYPQPDRDRERCD
jgi:integrase/recombinase XerC